MALYAPLKIATYNGGGRPGRRKFARQIRAAVNAGGGLASLQETGDRDFELDEVDDDPFLEVIVAGADGIAKRAHAAKVAIAYDTRRYAFERGEVVKVNDRTFVGPEGAGRSLWAPNRYVLVAYFRDLVTGRRVIAIAVHLIASVQAKHKGEKIRDELSEESVAVLVKLLRRLRRRHPYAVILLAGDLNFTPGHDNARPLKRVAVETSVALGTTGQRPTHGRRHIDHVWTVLAGRRWFVRIVADGVLPTNPDDHDTYVAELRVRFTRRWARKGNRRRVTLPNVPVSRG